MHYCVQQKSLFWSTCKAMWGAPRKALAAQNRDRRAHAAKEACDISHFRLMHRLLSSRQVAIGNDTTPSSALPAPAFKSLHHAAYFHSVTSNNFVAKCFK